MLLSNASISTALGRSHYGTEQALAVQNPDRN
jgi:hypothetical protein